MKSFAILSFLALAEAKQVNIVWNDCGAAHGKTTSLSPQTIMLGTTTTVTGSGTVDVVVSGGQYEIAVKAGIFRKKLTGNVCEPLKITIPMGVGTISWPGLKCPVAAGAVSIPVEVTLSRKIPKQLMSATATATAKETNGDDLLCMQMSTSVSETQEDEVAPEGGWPAEVVV